MAGMEGVEPPLTEPESAVLPLDDIPLMHPLRSCVAAFAQESILGDDDRRRKYFFEKVCGRGEIMQTAGQMGWLGTGSFQPTEQPVTSRGVPSMQSAYKRYVPDLHLGRGGIGLVSRYEKRLRRAFGILGSPYQIRTGDLRLERAAS